MPLKHDRDPKKMLADLKKTMTEMPTLIGNTAEVFFKEGFKLQAWQGDNGNEKWAPLKPATIKAKNGSTKILVRKGHLYGGIKKKVNGIKDIEVNVTGPDVKFAGIHNNGGEIQHPGWSRTLSFRKKKNGAMRFTQEGGRYKTIAQSKSKALPYKIKIERRHFIGNSRQLDNKLITQFEEHLNKVFNGK